MDAMNLKRQGYHNRALIGGGVHKVLQSSNIKKLVRIFRPLHISTKDGTSKVFSDVQLMNKITILLFKLSTSYQLDAPSVPLCRHEVTFVSVRCASVGSWFPLNFPTIGMLRKVHILTHHAPVKEAKLRSVGMEPEHCLESIRPIVNKLDRTQATIQNKSARLALVAKCQWLQSNSTLTNFKKARKQVYYSIISMDSRIF